MHSQVVAPASGQQQSADSSPERNVRPDCAPVEGREGGRSKLQRTFAALVGSAALAQLASLAASPVLTRLYSPSDFGTLAVFASVVLIAGAIATLRYEAAIPIPPSDAEAARVVSGTMLTVIFAGTAMGALVWGFQDALIPMVNAEGLRPYLLLLIPAVWGSGTYSALSQWAIRRQDYNRIARTRLGRSASLITVQTTSGIAGLAPLGLILGEVAGQIGGQLSLLNGLIRRDRHLFRGQNLRSITATMLRYRKFPALSGGATLLNVTVLYASPLLIAGLFDARAAGFYALAHRILMMPITLIGTSAGQMFLGEASSYARTDPGKMLSIFNQATKRLAAIGLVTGLAIALLAPPAFEFVFGSEWRQAGRMAQLLAPSIACQIMISPTGSILEILQRQELYLLREAVRVLLLGLAYGAAILMKISVLNVVALLSAAGVAGYLVHFAFSVYAIKVQERSSNGLRTDPGH